MATTNLMIPSPDWRMLTVTIPPNPAFKYAVLAPGCINVPHGGNCKCKTYDSQQEAEKYIRREMGV